MPTYDYLCETCEHEFEFSQSMKEKPLARCPASVCPRRIKGKGRVKRRLGRGAGLLFKGSGFYITDYRSESYKTAAKSDAPPAAAAADSAAPAGKSETKAEPKSEGKAESKAGAKEGRPAGPHRPKSKRKSSD
jgi:putative FmdB family regulatory protein